MVVLALLVAAGCASTAPEVDVYVVRVQPEPGTLLEQRMRLDLRIQNGSDTDLAVRGVKLALDVNGRRLARGVSDTAFAVPRLQEQTFSITTSTGIVDVARQLFAVPDSTQVNYELRGTLYLDGGLRRRVNFSREGQLKLGPDGSAGVLRSP